MRYILYACPGDGLDARVRAYYRDCAARIGGNTAHTYPPHCTLTGFIRDAEDADDDYRATCTAAMRSHADTAAAMGAAVRIAPTVYREDFYSLPLLAPAWEAVASAFAATLSLRRDAAQVRCKRQLHLSLAYDFPPAQHAPLRARAAAHDLDDRRADTDGWHLRLFRVDDAGTWTTLLVGPPGSRPAPGEASHPAPQDPAEPPGGDRDARQTHR